MDKFFALSPNAFKAYLCLLRQIESEWSSRLNVSDVHESLSGICHPKSAIAELMEAGLLRKSKNYWEINEL